MERTVTVIIPAHNAAKTIAKTLESALAQTHQALEILVIDDHSTDETSAIVQSFSDVRVRYLQNKARGASAARNTGILRASGGYLQFLDADDLLHHEKIQRQLSLLEETESLVCSGSWARFFDSIEGAQCTPNPLNDIAEPLPWVLCNLSTGAMMHPGAWLVKRSLIERAGLWDESLSLNDDGEFFIRIVLATRQVLHCPDATSYYRSGSGSSLSAASDWSSLYSRLRSLHLSMKILFSRQRTDATQSALADAFQRFMYEAYPFAPDLARAASETVKLLGGSEIAITGGPWFQRAHALMGWQLATRMRAVRKRYGQ